MLNRTMFFKKPIYTVLCVLSSLLSFSVSADTAGDIGENLLLHDTLGSKQENITVPVKHTASTSRRIDKFTNSYHADNVEYANTPEQAQQRQQDNAQLALEFMKLVLQYKIHRDTMKAGVSTSPVPAGPQVLYTLLSLHNHHNGMPGYLYIPRISKHDFPRINKNDLGRNLGKLKNHINKLKR